jgi:hypothetical protein
MEKSNPDSKRQLAFKEFSDLFNLNWKRNTLPEDTSPSTDKRTDANIQNTSSSSSYNFRNKR